MRQRNEKLFFMVVLISLSFVHAAAAGKPAPAAEQKQEETRLELLQKQHKDLMAQRERGLKAIAQIEKFILKLEGQIEEQQYIGSQSNKDTTKK